MYTYLIGDSITDTIKFTALDATTRETIKTNGIESSPLFDMIQFPSGLGFQQELDVSEGDTTDYVIRQTFKKKTITMTVVFKSNNAYSSLASFNEWFARYIDKDSYVIRFSYEINNIRRFCDCHVTNGEPQERFGNIVTENITIQPITPFYIEGEGEIQISNSNTGSSYSYTYPYKFGGGAYSDDNTITNSYIKKAPMRVKLYGPVSVTTPSITLSKVVDGEVEANPYARVDLYQRSLASNEVLVIDAFALKVYIETTNTSTGVVTKTDAYDLIDKTYQSFLFAEPGVTKIDATLETEGSRLTAYFVRYTL